MKKIMAKKPMFETLLSIFKAHEKKAIRDYAKTFHVADDSKIVYSDGFFILVADIPHKFARNGTYNIDGSPSSLRYPNYHSILPCDQKKVYEANALLKIARLVAPSTRKTVFINRFGAIENYDEKYNCNLSHAVIAAKLDCEACKETNDGFFIFESETIKLLSAGVSTKK
jgi:hypothetical protein